MTRYAGETHAGLKVITPSGAELDISGISSAKVRLNVGAADELTITIANKDLNGRWRSAMGAWQIGQQLEIHAGYDGSYEPIQKFDVYNVVEDYPDDGEPMLTIRGTSELARAARGLSPRLIEGDDRAVLREIAESYGWNLDLPGAIVDNGHRAKESGKSDLTLLKLIAAEAQRGGPRVEYTGKLRLPLPDASDPLVFANGPYDGDHSVVRRLHTFKPERYSGGTLTRVSVLAWDPTQEKFIETIMRLDRSGGQPQVVYTGPASDVEIPEDMTTNGIMLKVLEDRGEVESTVDYLASGRFSDAISAEALARRWFDLRERLSRWATATVDGHSDLMPYKAVIFDGDMSPMAKGLWLPMWVEHAWDSGSWKARIRAVRIVETPTILPSSLP